MTRPLVALLLCGVIAALATSASARVGPTGASARCKVVTKKVKGKKKRVRVCKRVPAPAPLPEAGTIAATIDVGASTHGLAVGGGAVWALTDAHQLVRIDPTTNAIVARIDLPASEWPEADVAYGEGAVWVTVASQDTADDPASDSVVRIDPATNAITARISVGHSPEGVGVTANAVWTANHRSDSFPTKPKSVGTFTVSRVDAGASREVARLPVEARSVADDWNRFCCGPQGLAIAGNNVWVADVGPGPGDAHLVHIDAQTNATTVTPVPTGNICAGVAADGAGVWAAAGCDDDHVTRFDPATGAVVTRVDVNKDGNGMAAGVAIGFGSIWVTALQNNFGGANSIARIDPATNKVVARTSLPDAPDVVQVGDGVLWIDVGKTVVRFTPAGAG